MTRHWVSGEEAAAVRAEVAAIFRANSQSYWADRFADVDCCVAPVLTLAESMANEQLCARDVHRRLTP
jgi:crotonobetainyl-CoA:carnitine CoA-transferase CaiB-like acyl-CoA transferase